MASREEVYQAKKFNYLLWCQDRGIYWDKYSQKVSPKKKKIVRARRNLLQTAGDPKAILWVCVDYRQKDGFFSPGERTLFLNMVQAMHLKAESQVRVVGFETDAQCRPLARAVEYQRALAKELESGEARVLIAFGPLCWEILQQGGGATLCYERYNFQACQQSWPVLRLDLLQLIEKDMDTKLKTWRSLQELLPLLSH